MTVAELIEKLKAMPQDMEIVAQDDDHECRDIHDPYIEDNGGTLVGKEWVPTKMVWL
jgi:hypothetical protein